MQKPNFLLITAAGLNYNSVDFFSNLHTSVTPNLRGLVDEGMRFNNAHVAITVGRPSRSTLMTGAVSASPWHRGVRGQRRPYSHGSAA